MSAMKIIQYILLVLLAALTVFNFYYFTVGRKRKGMAKAQYQQTLGIIERQAVAIVKREILPIETQMGYLNDRNQGILLTFDKAGQMAAIFLDGEHHIITADQFVKASQRYDQDGPKKITNVTVEVETVDSLLSLNFGGGSYRPTSYLGKFILEDSKDFCDRLTEHFTRRADQ